MASSNTPYWTQDLRDILSTRYDCMMTVFHDITYFPELLDPCSLLLVLSLLVLSWKYIYRKCWAWQGKHRAKAYTFSSYTLNTELRCALFNDWNSYKLIFQKIEKVYVYSKGGWEIIKNSYQGSVNQIIKLMQTKI